MLQPAAQQRVLNEPLLLVYVDSATRHLYFSNRGWKTRWLSRSEQHGLQEEYGALVAVHGAPGTAPTWRFSGLAAAAAMTLSGRH